MQKAQTATEYLIILAVIIIVAVIVISVLGVMPGSGGRVADDAAAAGLRLQDVGVTGYSITPAGATILLKNNQNDLIRVTGVSLGGVACSPQPSSALPVNLDLGQTRTIFCPNINDSSVGSRYELDLEIFWSYVPSRGTYVQVVERGIVGIVGEAAGSTEGGGEGTGNGGGTGEPSVPFSLEIVSPSGNVYDSTISLIIEATEFENIWFNWNGTNSTPQQTNISEQIMLSPGTYTLYAWANNSSGHVISENLTFTYQYFAGGLGTVGSPYEISTCQQLQNMKENLTAHYVLIDDIDCSMTSEWNWDGSQYLGFEPIMRAETSEPFWHINYIGFEGTFNGNNHKITNLYINSGNLGGLFGMVSGSISNFGLDSANITCREFADTMGCGGVVGMFYGDLENVYFIGEVNSQGNYDGSLGGLVGQGGGNISNSYVAAHVEGLGDLQGFVGFFYGIISNSYWDVNLSGIGNTGDDNYGATGRTTENMTTVPRPIDTFYNWDFDNIWTQVDGQYPKFRHD